MAVPERPRGTQDILPADQPYWRKMLRAAEAVAERSGYRSIETPIFEATNLFERGVGQYTDVVSKEMYTFTDRGGRQLTLRPEGTAPVVRAYFDGRLDQEPQPVRLYYAGPFFRYDRPQKGRFREFHQFGIEVLGESSPAVDVEAIELGWRWFEMLGITGVNLQLNSIGDEVCRPAYRNLLRDYYRPHLSELCEEDRVRFDQNPLRLLDCKNPSCSPLQANAPRITDHLCEPCLEAFLRVQAGLREIGLPFSLNASLVRGLDYYTRTAFEFWHESLGGAQNSLGGGGRYDGLAAELGFKSTPGIGFAMGMERAATILREKHPESLPGPDVYAVAIEPSDQPHLLKLASALRKNGYSVILDPTEAKLDAKLRRAAKRGARLVLIVAPEERNRGEVVLRNMDQKTQETVSEAGLVRAIAVALADVMSGEKP
jgi:histidyl-tRNA synthetase